MATEYQLLRTLTLKLFGRRDKTRAPVTVALAPLPQEIFNEIMNQYHALFPLAPLYPFLLVSRHMYEATIPCLYRNVVFVVDYGRQDKFLSFLWKVSMSNHRCWVRSLELINFRIKDFSGSPPVADEPTTRSLFLYSLLHLPQLRAISLRSVNERLASEILVTISQLQGLEVLELSNLRFVGELPNLPAYAPMQSLRRLLLTNLWEETIKWATFLPYTLNPNLRHFEFFRVTDQRENLDQYSFLRRLIDEPDLGFPEMRTIHLHQPTTSADVDHLVLLLQRSPGLVSLGFEARTLDGIWNSVIDELGSKLPSKCLSGLQAINGPPGLVRQVVPGRPITKVVMRRNRAVDTPLISSVASLRMSTAQIESLALWTNDWGDISLQAIADIHPHLKSLAVCVLSRPAIPVAEWKLDALGSLQRLEELALVAIDQNGRPTPKDENLQQRRAQTLFKRLPTLRIVWFHLQTKQWQRGETDSDRSPIWEPFGRGMWDSIIDSAGF